MDWWQTVGLMATLVATAIAVATLGWRILARMQRAIEGTRRELGGEIAGMRQELDGTRRELGGEIAGMRQELDGTRRELDGVRRELGGEIAGTRQESRDAHESIGSRLDLVREDLSADIARLRDDLGTDIASGRDGLVGVREGLAELRGEMRGLNTALQALQEDFRTHVYGRSARA